MHTSIVVLFTYMSSIWLRSPKNSTDCLKILQNKAIKSILHLPRLKILYNENLLSLKILAKYKLILQFKRMLDNLTKHNFKFLVNADIHYHNTRSKNAIHYKIYNTRYGENRFYNKASILY